MITEDYVSFETAKLLKEKGFDIPCNTYFVEVEKETAKNKIKRRFCHSSVVANRNAYKSEMANHYYFSCPTLQMAMKWLREKELVICVIPLTFYCGEKVSAWGYNIWASDNLEVYEENTPKFPTYEEACEAAIKYCLENLI